MNEYTLIDTNAKMTAFLSRLKERQVGVVAVDLEGEFNLHVYGEHFCLLQVYDRREQVAIDPQTVSIDLIRQFLEDRNLLKIAYDCASDRALLFKTHGIRFRSILDLRPAVELLDFQRQDLKSVLDSALGVESEGSKKQFQQYDWTRRPIRPEAINYALQDVEHLFALKDVLLERISRDGLLEQFILENIKRQDRDPEVNRKPGILRSGRFNKLNRDRQKLFRKIHDARERHAERLNLPPNTVVQNNDLFLLVTGEILPSEIRGNRRMPEESLRTIRDEFSALLQG